MLVYTTRGRYICGYLLSLYILMTGKSYRPTEHLKYVFDLVISSSISGLDGDGRAGPVWGQEQRGRPPLHQTAVLLQERHPRLGWSLGRGQCCSPDAGAPHSKRSIELEPVEFKSLRQSTTTGYFLHFRPHQLVNAVNSFSQGKGMLLVLQDRMLNLIDPDDHSLLHSQPISSIRVWGVGRDHDRSVMLQTWCWHPDVCAD